MNFAELLVSVFLGAMTFNPPADACSVSNTTTQNGETIDYTVYYSAAGLYINAGSATFTNQLEKLGSRTVYHVTGAGQSNSRYDWIYKVRDRYESFIDTATMLPLKFLRDVAEGKTKKKESFTFNHQNNTVTTDKAVIKIPACVQDVLSTVYFSRNINFDAYKKDDKIPYKMFLENEVHQLYVRYLGKENITTTFGKFRAIKLKAMLVEGTIFSGGESMTIWVTDDNNRIPVRIQSSILIGSIKVDMSSFKNLRHPLTSLQKKK